MSTFQFVQDHFYKPFLLALFTAAILGFLVSANLSILPLAVASVLPIILAFIFPRTSIMVLIVWTFLQNIPRSYLPGIIQQTDLLDELLLIALTIRWIILVLSGKQRFRRTPIDFPFLFFILFYVVSSLWNDVPFINSIFAFRDVFQYVLLFYAFVNLDFKPGALFRYIKVIYILAVANLIVLGIQVLIFYSKTKILFIEDEGVGLMGISGAHKLGYFAGILLVAYIARNLAGFKLKWHWFLILTIIIVFTSARAVYFWVPISLLFVFSERILSNPKWVFRISLMLTAFAGLILIYVNLPITKSATIDPRAIYKQQLGTEEGDTLRRVGFLQYSWETLIEHNPIIGTGPGSYVSKTPSLLGSPLFQKYQSDFPFKNSFNTGSQISLTIVEYGLLGIILILWIYLRLFIAAKRWTKKFANPEVKALAYGAKGMLLFVLLSMISINIFELQEVIVVPWIFLGVLAAFNYSYNFEHLRKLNHATED